MAEPDRPGVAGPVLADPEAVARAFLAAIADGDLARLDALLHPQATWWVLGWGDLDRGRFLASLERTITRASSRRMTVLGVTSQDDRAAVEAEGEFLFAEGPYCNRYHYLFRVADGRIIAGREYFDTAVAQRFF